MLILIKYFFYHSYALIHFLGSNGLPHIANVAHGRLSFCKQLLNVFFYLQKNVYVWESPYCVCQKKGKKLLDSWIGHSTSLHRPCKCVVFMVFMFSEFPICFLSSKIRHPVFITKPCLRLYCTLSIPLHIQIKNKED